MSSSIITLNTAAAVAAVHPTGAPVQDLRERVRSSLEQRGGADASREPMPPATEATEDERAGRDHDDVPAEDEAAAGMPLQMRFPVPASETRMLTGLRAGITSAAPRQGGEQASMETSNGPGTLTSSLHRAGLSMVDSARPPGARLLLARSAPGHVVAPAQPSAAVAVTAPVTFPQRTDAAAPPREPHRNRVPGVQAPHVMMSDVRADTARTDVILRGAPAMADATVVERASVPVEDPATQRQGRVADAASPPLALTMHASANATTREGAPPHPMQSHAAPTPLDPRWTGLLAGSGRPRNTTLSVPFASWSGDHRVVVSWAPGSLVGAVGHGVVLRSNSDAGQRALSFALSAGAHPDGAHWRLDSSSGSDDPTSEKRGRRPRDEADE